MLFEKLYQSEIFYVILCYCSLFSVLMCIGLWEGVLVLLLADIVQAIQLNHHKILDVRTILLGVWKVGVTRSNKPFAGCFLLPAGVGTGDGADTFPPTGEGADMPAVDFTNSTAICRAIGSTNKMDSVQAI